MSKPKDKTVSGEKTPSRAVSAPTIAPRTPLEFAQAVRQLYAAAEYAPNLFFHLISIECPEDLDPEPYAKVVEMLEVVIGDNPVYWEGEKTQGLEFLDMVIGLLESSSPL